MNNQDYEQQKKECWDAFDKEHPHSGIITEMAFNFAFDLAYALGREKETVSQEKIERASTEFADRECEIGQVDWDALYKGYYHGMKDSLGKKEKDAEGDKMLTCNKGVVQALYLESLKCAPKLERWKGIKWTLDNLFDSKCLLDLSEAKRILSENLSETTPAEPKFKLKDRVVRKYVSTIRTIVDIDSVSDETGTSYYYMTEDSHGNNRIEFVESDLELYTDPDTSHEMPVCENHSDDTSQKEVNVNSNRNLSQNIVNCDKQLDNILKDSFRNERRLNIAAMIEPSLIANPDLWKQYRGYGQSHAFAKLSLEFADALIAECEKGGLQ